MALEIVTADSQFLTELHYRIAAIRERQAGIERQDLELVAIERKHLVDICNIAFWASLHQEEGRSIRVNLAVGAAGEFENPLIFQTAEAFEVASLVNLAPAALGSVLGVHIGVDNRLEIWGIARRPPKPALNISIIKPGTVGIFFYQGFLPIFVGLIDNGELIIPNDASLETFQQLVADTFKLSAPDLGSRFRRAGQLIEIVHTMCAHGHGGTLLIVPDDTSWHEHVTFRYPCGAADGSDFLKVYSEASFLSGRKAERSETPPAQLPPPGPSNSLSQRAKKERALTRAALRRVGQLTAVDGAVVIGNTFLMYGFGATLKPPDNAAEIIALDAISGRNSLATPARLGGSRHQSAAQFVSSNTQSIAIISSQDGGLTLVGRPSDKPAIIAIQNLQHLLINWQGPIERWRQ